ncbi:hypothetical protein GCM10023196_036250 [Actinoallomurus vinaceus]|uniref:Uncharacterized protein n=1 Tax=Actinoallomurus vinaceus TaxID=1080074 RepID=A0ABP8U912_9ACTN
MALATTTTTEPLYWLSYDPEPETQPRPTKPSMTRRLAREARSIVRDTLVRGLCFTAVLVPGYELLRVWTGR